MKHIKFRTPIYNADVWVVIDEREASRLAAVKCGVYHDDDDFDMRGAVFYGNDNNVVWLPADCSVSTMAHEVTHIALNICRRRGVKVDTRNQEPVAYLMGFVFESVVQAHTRLREAKNNG